MAVLHHSWNVEDRNFEYAKSTAFTALAADWPKGTAPRLHHAAHAPAEFGWRKSHLVTSKPPFPAGMPGWCKANARAASVDPAGEEPWLDLPLGWLNEISMF